MWMHSRPLSRDHAPYSTSNGPTYWMDRQLPELPTGSLGIITTEMNEEENRYDVKVELVMRRGGHLVFREPAEEFPSETMLARILLVA